MQFHDLNLSKSLLDSVQKVVNGENVQEAASDNQVMNAIFRIANAGEARKVEFEDGSKEKITPDQAKTLAKLHDMLDKKEARDQFAKTVAKSPDSMKSAMKRVKKESVDEAKQSRPQEKFAMVDSNNKIVAKGTDDKDLKMERSSIADRLGVDKGDLKVVTLKKPQKIGDKLSENVNERELSAAEKRKREEVAKSIEKDNPDMDKSKKMAIATKQAKKSTDEGYDLVAVESETGIVKRVFESSEVELAEGYARRHRGVEVMDMPTYLESYGSDTKKKNKTEKNDDDDNKKDTTKVDTEPTDREDAKSSRKIREPVEVDPEMKKESAEPNIPENIDYNSNNLAEKKSLPADDDDDTGASKNIIAQLRKASNSNSGADITFGSGKSMKVSRASAMKALNKFSDKKKPDDKEEFQKKLGQSPDSFNSALNESTDGYTSLESAIRNVHRTFNS